MSNYLKYDVECLEKNKENIDYKKETIKTNMDNITTSINDLKSEWDTIEAQAIKGAKAKYAEIEINAKNNLVFNKM